MRFQFKKKSSPVRSLAGTYISISVNNQRTKQPTNQLIWFYLIVDWCLYYVCYLWFVGHEKKSLLLLRIHYNYNSKPSISFWFVCANKWHTNKHEKAVQFDTRHATHQKKHRTCKYLWHKERKRFVCHSFIHSFVFFNFNLMDIFWTLHSNEHYNCSTLISTEETAPWSIRKNRNPKINFQPKFCIFHQSPDTSKNACTIEICSFGCFFRDQIQLEQLTRYYFVMIHERHKKETKSKK